MTRRQKIRNWTAIACGWLANGAFFLDWTVLGGILLAVCVTLGAVFMVESLVWLRRTRREMDEIAAQYRPRGFVE